jgi:hypothetical protein
MNFVESFLYKKPRLAGLLFILLGIGISCHLIWAYREGNRLFSKDLTSAPVALILGLGIVLEPRIWLVWRPQSGNTPPFIYKVVSTALIIVAVGIGLYLRYVVFKDWQPARFSFSS